MQGKPHSNQARNELSVDWGILFSHTKETVATATHWPPLNSSTGYLRLYVTDRWKSNSTIAPWAPPGEYLRHDFVAFGPSARGHKPRIWLETSFRWNGASCLRIKKRRSPLRPTGLLCIGRPMTCTCLSQTGESHSRQSLHGLPGVPSKPIFAGFWRSDAGHKLRIKLEPGSRWIGASQCRTKERPSPLQPSGHL